MISLLKKLLIFFGAVVVLLLATFLIIYLLYNEELPEGVAGPKAEEKAQQILKALNKEGWDQIQTIKWTFNGHHHYDWDKKNNIVSVKWKDNEVILVPDNQTGTVKGGESLSEKETQKRIQKAIEFFNNDGFWLYAPYKIFDPGTERSLVTLSDGREGLKVTYTTGGSTPGDSYVWIVDENNIPTSVKLWVSIIPIGGVELSWENYHTFKNGAMIAQDHWFKIGINSTISNLEATFEEPEGTDKSEKQEKTKESNLIEDTQ